MFIAFVKITILDQMYVEVEDFGDSLIESLKFAFSNVIEKVGILLKKLIYLMQF